MNCFSTFYIVTKKLAKATMDNRFGGYKSSRQTIESLLFFSIYGKFSLSEGYVELFDYYFYLKNNKMLGSNNTFNSTIVVRRPNSITLLSTCGRCRTHYSPVWVF